MIQCFNILNYISNFNKFKFKHYFLYRNSGKMFEISYQRICLLTCLYTNFGLLNESLPCKVLETITLPLLRAFQVRLVQDQQFRLRLERLLQVRLNYFQVLSDQKPLILRTSDPNVNVKVHTGCSTTFWPPAQPA